MAPDYIADIALLTTSSWQRKASMGFRSDLNDTIEVCWEDGEFLEAYLSGDSPAHFTLPVPMWEAEIASNHTWITGYHRGPSMNCIAAFMDGVEYFHLL